MPLEVWRCDRCHLWCMWRSDGQAWRSWQRLKPTAPSIWQLRTSPRGHVLRGCRFVLWLQPACTFCWQGQRWWQTNHTFNGAVWATSTSEGWCIGWLIWQSHACMDSSSGEHSSWRCAISLHLRSVLAVPCHGHLGHQKGQLFRGGKRVFESHYRCGFTAIWTLQRRNIGTERLHVSRVFDGRCRKCVGLEAVERHVAEHHTRLPPTFQ